MRVLQYLCFDVINEQPNLVILRHATCNKKKMNLEILSFCCPSLKQIDLFPWLVDLCFHRTIHYEIHLLR